MAADDFAVVVGISRYPGVGDLSGPENDATDFHQWICSPSGANTPTQNVTLILSSQYQIVTEPLQAEPTEVAVQRAFDAFDATGRATGRVGRRLYIYMAGHGFSPDFDEAALLMANAAEGRFYHIAGRQYANHFRRAGYFEEIVLFMDCCRNDYTRAPLIGPQYERRTSTRQTRTFYGFATKWSRGARERPLDQTGRVRGLFTAALLAALGGGARRDAKGKVTGPTVRDFVYNFLERHFPAGERQEPEFQVDGEIEFPAGPPSVYHVRLTLSPANLGKQVHLVGGDLQPIPGNNPSPQQWEWYLPPGLYLVRLNGTVGQPLQLIGEGGRLDVTI